MVGCDRISELPESLLTQILSYLETKESVTTSSLSKRWKYLWLKVPALELNCIDYPYSEVLDGSKYCVDKYLEFNDISRMQKLTIHYDDLSAYRDHCVEWIYTMVDRGLQHLCVTAVHHSRFYRDPMPLNIYTSKTLVSLKLSNVALMNPDPELGIFLPCLKIMHLEDMVYYDENGVDASVLEKLISGCPVLEDLSLSFPYKLRNTLFVRVRSQTLKSFRCWFPFKIQSRDFLVEIVAPELTYMCFWDLQSERIVMKNLTSLSKIYIYSDCNVKHGRTLDGSSTRDMIRDFLTGISTVRISMCTLEVLFCYTRLGRPIPRFDNLYRLLTGLSSSLLITLPAFLESFPNLKNFTLLLSLSKETDQGIKLSRVPQCLLSSLECVEIKHLFMVEETSKKLAMYFLENSAVLKKLTLRFKGSSEENQHSEDIFNEFHTFTKLSPGCEIIISIENVT